MLRRAQAEALAAAEPVWHDDWSGLPDGPLILVANEFLDALPIRQLLRLPDGWHERVVALTADGETLDFGVDSAVSAATAVIPKALRHAPAGSLVELRPAALTLAQTLGARLARQGGLALFIDYGGTQSSCGTTLQALRRHRRHEVLDDPGEADLTAHVDFAAFAAAAREGGARAWGPVPQAQFLARLGVAERESALLARATPAQAEAIRSGCRRLIAPDEMGTLFKALALADPALPAPSGFAGDHDA